VSSHAHEKIPGRTSISFSNTFLKQAKKMATHMFEEPDDATPRPTASNPSSHKATRDHHAGNANHHVNNDVIYATSQIPSMTLEHLLLESEQCKTTLDIRDAYFLDTANDDADSDTSNNDEDMDMTTTIMSANSYDLAYDEYDGMLPTRNDNWIVVHITIFSQNNFQQLHIQQFANEYGFKGYI
jgi:hypothetical protein